MNTQKKSPRLNSNTLEVHSIFKTIQGEGPFAGEPAIFVRLYGCNLQCPMCDTDYTSDLHDMSATNISDKIAKLNPSTPDKDKVINLIVITGGEPFRQTGLKSLTNLLLLEGYKVQIETNGTLYQPLNFSASNLSIICSPKTTNLSKELLPHITAYKYVLDYQNVAKDGLPSKALDHPVGITGLYRPKKGSKIYLHPMDPKADGAYLQNVRAVTKSCLEYGYTLGLQIHKIIGVE